LKHVLLWGPVVLVMAVIFSASSMSDPGAPPGGLSDKAAHFAVYAALGASLVRALAGGRPAAMTAGRILLAILLATLYGVSDEFHQSFVPERTPDVMDVAADALGASAGAVLLTAVARALTWLLRTRAGG
jgi:VanZ family protein